MASVALTNCLLARDQATANIVAATAAPKPDYGIDGQSVSWSAYVTAQAALVKQLNELIAMLDPYMRITQVR